MQAANRTWQMVPVAFFFAAAGVIFWQTNTIMVAEGVASGGPQYNAAFVPEILAWLLVLFGLWQGARILLGREVVDDDTAPAPDAAPPPERNLVLRAGLCFLALVAFAAALRPAGYYLAMPGFLALAYMLLGVRNPLVVILWTGALTLGAGFAFGHLLNVRLPVGIWAITIW